MVGTATVQLQALILRELSSKSLLLIIIIINPPIASGNNAISYKADQTTGTTLESSTGLNFAYVQDPTTDPTTAVNVDAAVTNAFYVVNTIHDISYLYGFTEAAFNFQDNNFGKGGAAADRISISVQDSLATDNSAFTTFPE